LLKNEVSLLKSKLEKFEKTLISNKIIIDGISEEKNENISELLKKVATGLNIKFN
jgi:hypothetical protein